MTSREQYNKAINSLVALHESVRELKNGLGNIKSVQDAAEIAETALVSLDIKNEDDYAKAVDALATVESKILGSPKPSSRKFDFLYGNFLLLTALIDRYRQVHA